MNKHNFEKEKHLNIKNLEMMQVRNLLHQIEHLLKMNMKNTVNSSSKNKKRKYDLMDTFSIFSTNVIVMIMKFSMRQSL